MRSRPRSRPEDTRPRTSPRPRQQLCGLERSQDQDPGLETYNTAHFYEKVIYAINIFSSSVLGQ